MKELLDYTNWFWYGDPSIKDFMADLVGISLAVAITSLLECFGWEEFSRSYITRLCSSLRQSGSSSTRHVESNLSSPVTSMRLINHGESKACDEESFSPSLEMTPAPKDGFLMSLNDDLHV
eukprot:CAMPEP_0184478486 /NCGR_PEP_ID=MMETSP0113_2-20130426/502_1 /TAXON_ID=91329 /ORGANISM="Norrisiella sphaerica, Strain BC52" /LENGTH=120 /DNA_ID=CAMNT_0026856295 /DNA_START=240 /DNA_END=602 /DNA_ORIENTATION=+